MVSAVLIAAAPQSAQAAATPKERRFASMINGTRTAATLNPMKLSNHLSDIARKHSKHMASKGELYHSNLERFLGKYQKTGVGIVRADGQIWITQVFAA
jgi:uncharacterized protein YkwD